MQVLYLEMSDSLLLYIQSSQSADIKIWKKMWISHNYLMASQDQNFLGCILVITYLTVWIVHPEFIKEPAYFETRECLVPARREWCLSAVSGSGLSCRTAYGFPAARQEIWHCMQRRCFLAGVAGLWSVRCGVRSASRLPVPARRAKQTRRQRHSRSSSLPEAGCPTLRPLRCGKKKVWKPPLWPYWPRGISLLLQPKIF